MPGLPLTVAVSLVLAFLLLRAVLMRAPWPLLVLIGLLALQGLVLALAGQSTIPRAVLASLVPPLAGFAFQATTAGADFGRWHAMALLAGPIAVIVLVTAFPDGLDPALFVWFAAHGIAILLSLSQPGSLASVPIGEQRKARLIWAGAGVALVVSALVDLIVAVFFLLGERALVPVLIDLSAAVFLVALAAMALLAGLMPTDAETSDRELPIADGASSSPAGPPALVSDEEARAIVERAEAWMRARQAWRDPGLSLRRMAAKLQIPERRLSAAINRATQDSVSRFVTRFRVTAACQSLDAGLPVTEAMLNAGFSTKSHFNAEFKRMTGMTPSGWTSRNREAR